MKRAFTLIEVMTVILIIGILAAVSVGAIQGKVEQAKWSEAYATAGMIRRNARAYYIETGNKLKGKLNKRNTLNALGITASEVAGTYFIARDYRIKKMDDQGNCEIIIISSQPDAPDGRKTLTLQGEWR